MDGKVINGNTVGALLRDAVDPRGWQNAEVRELTDMPEIFGTYPVLGALLQSFAAVLYINMCAILEKTVDDEIVHGFVNEQESKNIQLHILFKFLDWWMRLDKDQATVLSPDWFDPYNLMNMWCKAE